MNKDIDPERFEIRETEEQSQKENNSNLSDEENLDVPDPEDDIKMTHYKLWSLKKERFVKPGDKMNVVVSMIHVAQGNLVLYATMA